MRKNCSKEMSLSSYYDEVALKGLELAARDLARGVLTRPQVECIKEAVITLVTELADYDDVDPGTAPKASPDRSAAQDLPKHPAPDGAMPEALELPAKWRDEKPIQCVAGRGPLDDATAAILAQLLEKLAWARKSLRMTRCHGTQSAGLGGKVSRWSASAIST